MIDSGSAPFRVIQRFNVTIFADVGGGFPDAIPEVQPSVRHLQGSPADERGGRLPPLHSRHHHGPTLPGSLTRDRLHEGNLSNTHSNHSSIHNNRLRQDSHSNKHSNHTSIHDNSFLQDSHDNTHSLHSNHNYSKVDVTLFNWENMRKYNKDLRWVDGLVYCR